MSGDGSDAIVGLYCALRALSLAVVCAPSQESLAARGEIFGWQAVHAGASPRTASDSARGLYSTR